LSADWIQRRLQLRPATGTPEDCNVPPAPTVLLTLTAFLDAVAGGKPMPVTGEDGCRAVEIAEACYRSAAAGGCVVSLPLRG
jgi:predicted dehydrogenase